MSKPITTRLRYASAKKPEVLVQFTNSLGVRVQIYGAPQWDGKKWYLFFVPSDDGADIKSIDL